MAYNKLNSNFVFGGAKKNFEEVFEGDAREEDMKYLTDDYYLYLMNYEQVAQQSLELAKPLLDANPTDETLRDRCIGLAILVSLVDSMKKTYRTIKSKNGAANKAGDGEVPS